MNNEIVAVSRETSEGSGERYSSVRQRYEREGPDVVRTFESGCAESGLHLSRVDMATATKLAIVGAGPSAFYVASRLLSLLPLCDPRSPVFRVHLFDRSWAPHGLVRYGVAPDHPEVKVSFLPCALPRSTHYALELYS